MTRLVSAEEARGLLTWATPGPWYVDSSGRGVEYNSPDIGAVEVVAWTAKGDTKLIAAAPDLAATVIALSEDRDRTQEHVIRLTAENVNLLRWQSVAADAHLDHLCAMVTSLAANDETPRALRSISAESVVSELRRTFDAERVNRAKSEAESVTLRKAAEDMEGRALDAEKERDEARADRDRLRAMLACERGEAAPEGWEAVIQGGGLIWMYADLSRGFAIKVGKEWHWSPAPDVESTPFPTALEAIEAADRAPTLK